LSNLLNEAIMHTPTELLYTASHEWIKKQEDGSLLVGITEHAQDALGDIIFLELPTVGKKVSAGDACCVIESVKAASDIYSPVSGSVTAVNDALVSTTDLVNKEPYASWLFTLQADNLSDLDNLLSAEQYLASIGA
jgi:glycine cleavage system H protein